MICSLVVLFVAVSAQSQAEEGDYYNGESIYAKCVNCHTRDPKFAGDSVSSLNKRMIHFRDGTVTGPLLEAKKKLFSDFSDKDIYDLATYLSEM